jgi:hypothetical protein
MTGFVRGLFVIAAISLAVSVASASPPRLLAARFSAACDSYTVAVTGEGLVQPNAVVSYNLKLKPRSGEAILLVDSFPLTPDKAGSFQNTFHGFWKSFGYALTGKYTLSGTAILASNLIPLHVVKIAFSPSTLKCGPDSGIRSLTSALRNPAE